MKAFEVLILALVQGVAEFLPISSSGHLVLTQVLLGFKTPPIWLDVWLHLGTFFSILVFFNQKIWQFYKKPQNLKLVFIGSLPAFLFGYLVYPHVEQIFASTFVVGLGLLFTSGLLFSTKHLSVTKGAKLSSQKSLVIGFFQALAIFPGVSRSGSTISGAIFQKMSLKKAFQFSFFLSLPVILGAVFLDFLSSPLALANLGWGVFGALIAFLVGLVSLKLLKTLVVKKNLYLFGFYCLALGFLTLFLSF